MPDVDISETSRGVSVPEEARPPAEVDELEDVQYAEPRRAAGERENITL